MTVGVAVVEWEVNLGIFLHPSTQLPTTKEPIPYIVYII